MNRSHLWHFLFINANFFFKLVQEVCFVIVCLHLSLLEAVIAPNSNHMTPEIVIWLLIIKFKKVGQEIFLQITTIWFMSKASLSAEICGSMIELVAYSWFKKPQSITKNSFDFVIKIL